MLPRLAGNSLSRRAIGARFEVDIPQTALSTSRKQSDLLVLGQVGDRFPRIRIRDHGAGGHAQNDVIGALAVALTASALFAVARTVDSGEPVIDESVDVPVRDRVHAAAAAAVTPVRPTARHEFFAPEAHGAVATLAGMHLDARFVDEIHGDETVEIKKPYRADRAFVG